MKKTTHPIYADYPKQPYISAERDLVEWEKHPEKFPYSKVERKQMILLPEGLLPGEIVLLWRIHFNTFHNETIIPQYFEYKYGINTVESLNTLIKLGYGVKCNATQSLELLNIPIYKKILKEKGLAVTGKKQELIHRIVQNISEEELAALYSLRKYAITPEGTKLLQKYDNIIQLHGPKM